MMLMVPFGKCQGRIWKLVSYTLNQCSNKRIRICMHRVSLWIFLSLLSKPKLWPLHLYLSTSISVSGTQRQDATATVWPKNLMRHMCRVHQESVWRCSLHYWSLFKYSSTTAPPDCVHQGINTSFSLSILLLLWVLILPLICFYIERQAFATTVITNLCPRYVMF